MKEYIVLDQNGDQVGSVDTFGGAVRLALTHGGIPEEAGPYIDLEVDEDKLYAMTFTKYSIIHSDQIKRMMEN